jgi:hypothetical protein
MHLESLAAQAPEVEEEDEVPEEPPGNNIDPLHRGEEEENRRDIRILALIQDKEG